ncbi:MAG: HAD-IIA family hydrolase, partial [Anaerolineae bacterium]
MPDHFDCPVDEAQDKYRGFIFDLDGTIYRGERALPGAVEVVRMLRGRGRPVVFMSNKPLEPRAAYAAKLTRLGMPTEPSDVLTSAVVLAHHLRQETPEARLFVIGEPPLLAEMRDAGFRLSDEPAEIDVVVAAFDRTFDYAKWNTAFQAIRRGARFVATNADRTCPVEGGEIPDCAGIIAALEATTEKKVELVAGKPSRLMIQAGLDRMGLPAEQVLMVGDRLETDILMGKRAGTATALVLTGVTRRAQLDGS